MNAIAAVAELVVLEIFRKKDFYVAFLLIFVILFYAAQMTFFDVSNVVRYLMELGLTLVFLFSVILTTVLAARQLPNETQQKTAQALLAKPVSRAQFVAGKFLGTLAAGGAAFTLFYSLFLIVASVKGGGEGIDPILALETYVLFLFNLAVVAAMSCAFSYFLTTSANVALSLVLYLLLSMYGAGLHESSSHLFWLSRAIGTAFYYALPHFEFFDLRQRFIHRWPPLPVRLMVFLAAYAAAYSSAFLGAAWIRFRRQPL